MRVYQDGVAQADTEASGIPLIDAVSRTTVIGNDWDGVTPFDGAVSLVKIWNRALSAEEIAEIYQSEKGSYLAYCQ